MNNTKKYVEDNLLNIIYTQAQNEHVNVNFEQMKTLFNCPTSKLNINLHDLSVIYSLFKTWNFVLSNLNKEINLEYIKQINLLVSDLSNFQPGYIRDKNVVVKVTNEKNWVAPNVNTLEFKNNLNTIMEETNILKKSLDLYLLISRSQLFENCNKRTALICANIILIKNDLCTFYIKNDSIKIYNYFLAKFYEDFDLNSYNEIKCFIIENCLHNIKLDYCRKNNQSMQLSKNEVLQILKLEATT